MSCPAGVCRSDRTGCRLGLELRETSIARGTVRLSLSDKELLELDDLCGKFEKEWKPNSGLIDRYLSRASNRLRSFLVKELVAVECELLARSGYESSCTELRSRLPEWSGQIDEACSDCLLLTKDGVCESRAEHARQFGDYRVLREIGRGGAGIV